MNESEKSGLAIGTVLLLVGVGTQILVAVKNSDLTTDEQHVFLRNLVNGPFFRRGRHGIHFKNHIITT